MGAMTMNAYLTEMRHAVQALLPLIWDEAQTVEELHKNLHRLHDATVAGYSQAEVIALNAEDADDVAEATGRHWETYWGADKERVEVASNLDAAREQFRVHRFSVDALSAALLQYGRQGISVVHGGLSAAPKGRAVGNQTLSQVIWQGRNQALHWEDGQFNHSVVKCFTTLASDFDPIFGQLQSQSLAFEVITTLDWRTWSDFEADMQSLA